MIKNERYAGEELATAWGTVTFDQDGLSNDFTPEVQKELAGKLNGWEFIEDPKPEPKPKADPKPKPEPKPKADPKPKATAKDTKKGK